GERLGRLVACGQRRVVAIVVAPHSSGLSGGAYEEKVLDAARGRLDLGLVRSWGDHPKFLEAVAERVRRALQRFPVPGAVQVLFTAHSLPERILAAGDPYADELQASAAAVARLAGVGEWRFAYQSAGATPEPWLGPEAGAVMTELAATRKNFLIVPIGFVSDHVEVLYDVDVAYRGLAERLGVRLERTDSLNDDPLLVAALADLARRTATARAAGRGARRPAARHPGRGRAADRPRVPQLRRRHGGAHRGAGHATRSDPPDHAGRDRDRAHGARLAAGRDGGGLSRGGRGRARAADVGRRAAARLDGGCRSPRAGRRSLCAERHRVSRLSLRSAERTARGVGLRPGGGGARSGARLHVRVAQVLGPRAVGLRLAARISRTGGRRRRGARARRAGD